MRKNKGITLIALIITIIVMLILVGVSVSILVESDLIGAAEKAGDAYKSEYKKEQNMGEITIGDKTYESIDDYIKETQTEKITFYIRDNEYTVAAGTTWGQFLSKNQIPHYVDDDGSTIYYEFDLIDSNHCSTFGMPDEAIGSYCYCKSGGGPFLENDVNHQTGPWIYPSTLIKDGASYDE